jgi:hypothetical protein
VVKSLRSCTLRVVLLEIELEVLEMMGFGDLKCLQLCITLCTTFFKLTIRSVFFRGVLHIRWLILKKKKLGCTKGYGISP